MPCFLRATHWREKKMEINIARAHCSQTGQVKGNHIELCNLGSSYFYPIKKIVSALWQAATSNVWFPQREKTKRENRTQSALILEISGPSCLFICQLISDGLTDKLMVGSRARPPHAQDRTYFRLLPTVTRGRYETNAKNTTSAVSGRRRKLINVLILGETLRKREWREPPFRETL